MSIEEMVAADRKRQPELWEKVDRVAALVDPGAFPVGETVIEPPEAAERYRVRLAYMQSAARHRAMQILQVLGIAPEHFDWMDLFEYMASTDRPAEEGSDD